MNKSLVATLAFLLPILVSAHVAVHPSEVGMASWETFSVGVPVEKEVPTTEMRLVIPEGITSVTPNVKPGWTITVTKEGEGEDAIVKEIVWSGGSIPSGQRDDFVFSAKTPAEKTSLLWKAYQTYSDGTVVSWDGAPEEHGDDAAEEEEESETQGPASVTQVIDDLADEIPLAAPAPVIPMVPEPLMPIDQWAALSLAMSGSALFLVIRLSMRKKDGPSNIG